MDREHKGPSPEKKTASSIPPINTTSPQRNSGPNSGRKQKEPFSNYLSKNNINPQDETYNARLVIRIDHASKVYEHVVEAPPTTIKELGAKLYKPMKKPTSSRPVTKQDPVFGVPLAKYMQIQQAKNPHLSIPPFLKESIRFLLRKGLGVEGLFRTDGSKTELRELIDSINGGEELQLSEFNDIVLVGDLVKTYLQELPEPLISSKYYATYLAIESLPIKALQVDALKKIISCLPPSHQDFLQELLTLFHHVSLNCAVNLMTTENLAIIFSPIMVWKKETSAASVQELVKDMNKSARVLTLAIQELHQLFPSKPVSEENETGLHAPEFARKLAGHNSTIQAICVSYPTNEVWTGDHLGVICIWNLESCSYKRKIVANRGIIFSILMTDDVVWVASSNCLQIRHIKDNYDIIREIEGTFFSLLTVDYCIWGGSVDHIQIFREDQKQNNIDIKKAKFNTMALNNDRVWTSSETDLYIFSAKDFGLILHVQEAHTKKVNDIVFLNDNAWTCSDDGSIKIWRLVGQTCDVIHKFDAHTSPVNGLSVFGSHVWSCSSDQTIRIWDSSTFEKLNVLSEYHSDAVMKATLVWRPSAKKWFAWTTSSDASICIWETAYKIGLNKKT
eukprot:TRINITY_DN11138_c0_g1_i1.p1 TRINITY_DN11138_c0_g1~~TRINITY_DN11138_c0_g1_i1.p1  ORF type:complete len:634 (+),score=99.03 TRINITY_DN11138_c0_g1_i1:49-1902(+)